MSEEKGKKKKLLGRFNILDLIILLVVVGVLGTVAWRFVSSATNAEQPAEITYTVKVENVDKAMVPELEKFIPAQLVSEGMFVDGYVTEIRSEPQTKHEIGFDDSKKAVYIIDGENYVNLLFTITAKIQPSDGKTRVGSQEVRIGREHVVKTIYMELRGVTISLDGR